MQVYKKVEIDLTYEEKQALLKARDIIDTLIEKMFQNNLVSVSGEYDTYDDQTLDEIATDLHNIATIREGNQRVLTLFFFTLQTNIRSFRPGRFRPGQNRIQSHSIIPHNLCVVKYLFPYNLVS